MGDYCSINRHAYIDNRPYVRLGNNVRMAMCYIFGHDGSVNMINRAFDLRLDNVGKVDIRDNVYIGFGAIILPDVKIGPNAIVSAGSVVRSDVGEGDIVTGVPAKRAGRLEFSVAMLKAKNQKLPWRHLVEQRPLDHYPADTEAELSRMRVRYFFDSDQ
jgi:acetyltransferase-like isoleucine patch superfamily enzyme